MVSFALVCLFCAAVPACLFLANLALYREPPPAGASLPAVSILIPARNEATGIGDALRAALRTRDVPFEVIVMDDSSTDGTAEIVAAIAGVDSRVWLEQAPVLPPGWNGKQHACWALAHAARQPILCFVDADVRLGPDCISRMTAFLEQSKSSLVSGFPRQLTETTLEWLLLPLIHFVLLGFLPISRMRKGTDPAFAAGCGQFMLCRKEEYLRCGGHSGIKLTMHDGLLLPRLFRAAGMRTDLADITKLATCRMYTTGHQVWNGLAKNATEGIADPRRIVPVSLILLLGQVVPCMCALLSLLISVLLLAFVEGLGMDVHSTRMSWVWILFISAAAIVAWLPRILSTLRFKQDWRSALFHPFGILVLLAIQWYALQRKLRGNPVAWRDRTYTAEAPD